MPTRILYVLLTIFLTSCSNEGNKEFKFREFSSDMPSSELKKIQGYRETIYDPPSRYESVLFFDKNQTDGYTALIQKNHLDQTFAIKIILDIPRELTIDDTKNDIINKYQQMGKINLYYKHYETILNSEHVYLTFGCNDCDKNTNVDCDEWWSKLDHIMTMCVDINRNDVYSMMSIYWYNFKESEKLKYFIEDRRERERKKIKF